MMPCNLQMCLCVPEWSFKCGICLNIVPSAALCLEAVFLRLRKGTICLIVTGIVTVYCLFRPPSRTHFLYIASSAWNLFRDAVARTTHTRRVTREVNATKQPRLRQEAPPRRSSSLYLFDSSEKAGLLHQGNKRGINQRGFKLHTIMRGSLAQWFTTAPTLTESRVPFCF